MDKNSKIYVAGHRGMVGSAIIRQLKKTGYENLVFFTSSEIDLRNQHSVEKMFDSHKPEYVFLAAAKVGGILANNTYKADFIYDNLAIALNIIHSSHKFGVKKLVNLGSSCIYPKFAPQPLKEESLLTGLLEPTNEPYAIAKIAALKLCNYYHEQYGSEFVTIMPPNLYGHGDNYNLETSHVLPALIRKFKLAKALEVNDFDYIRNNFKKYPVGFGYEENKNEFSVTEILKILTRVGITAEKVSLWGAGDILREFEHADDIASAAVEVTERISASEIGDFLNVGSGYDITIGELAEMIKDCSGFKGEIEYDTRSMSGTPKKLLDSSRAFALGIVPKIELRDGIKKIMDEF